MPPQLSASRIDTVAATSRTAPSRSSLCGRSWRGRRFRPRLEMKSASSPSGQVDPEDHRPVQVLGEKPAEHRPGEARGHEHAGEIDLVAAALPGRHEIGDDGLRERDEPAAAEALQAARQDQERAWLGASAQAIEPTMKTAMPISSVIRRPWVSLNLP